MVGRGAVRREAGGRVPRQLSWRRVAAVAVVTSAFATVVVRLRRLVPALRGDVERVGALGLLGNAQWRKWALLTSGERCELELLVSARLLRSLFVEGARGWRISTWVG